MAFDAADLAHAQRDIDAGDVIAGLGQHHGDAGAGVRGAADDLLFALIRHHATDPQPVGIGVLFGMQNPGQGKGRKLCRRIGHALDLKPKIGQRLGDLRKRGGGVEMLLEPGEGEFHVYGPVTFGVP